MPENSNQVGEYLVYLVRCALQETKPMNLPEGVCWEQIFRMAYKHKVTNLVYQSVKQVEKKPEDEILSQWRLLAQKAELTEMMYEAELSGLLKAMEKAGIKYLCLKGIVLRTLYPSRGMREMSDQDILYDAGRRDDLMRIMEECGYEYEPKSKDWVHDVFRKQPNYMFEMHRMAVDNLLPENSYYKKIWKRAVKNKDGMYGYHMTWEDFLLFQIVHLKKHYERCGAGVKMAADIYVLYCYLKDQIDWEYIETELCKLNDVEFARESILRALWMFGNEEERCLAETKMGKRKLTRQVGYIVRSGAYGTDEIGYENKVKEAGGKARYFFRRVFKSYDEMKAWIPLVENRPWLCPFINIYRIFVGSILHSKRIIREIKIIDGLTGLGMFTGSCD